jgi:hypothetical protein
MEKYPVKKYPVISACGLDCGLCPAYHRETPSRCPGCCGQGFWEKSQGCGFVTCCVKKRGLEVCAQCVEFEFCPRVIKLLKQAEKFDSLLSYQTIAGNFTFIREYGIEPWVKGAEEKIAFLDWLLDNYNDGRSKGLYCLSVQLLPIDQMKKAMADNQIDSQPDIRNKAKLIKKAFNSLASASGIELKLRSKIRTA